MFGAVYQLSHYFWGYLIQPIFRHRSPHYDDAIYVQDDMK